MKETENKDFGVVYVILNPDLNIVKIGKSKQIAERLLALCCASGVGLEIIYTSKPTHNYSEIERIAHTHFKKNRRIHGEWFDINPSDAYLYISKLVDEEKIHPVCLMYESGKSINDIAIHFKVSRAYITKLLKNWNLYKKEKTVYHTREKTIKVLGKKTITIVDNIPSKFKKNSKYKRVSENIYKHLSEEVYKVKAFKNSILYEKYFNNYECAKGYLKTI